jgi:glycerophosphoryl diester phosphodiesterase
MRAALAAVTVAALPLSAVGACQGMVLHAHHGAPDAPENSPSGARMAFEGGWEGAEIDIQQLRDKSWVLHHDLLLGRTSIGPGGTVYNGVVVLFRKIGALLADFSLADKHLAL